MAVECSKCSYPVPEEDGKAPPWCPRCGGDLRSAAAPSQPAVLEVAGVVASYGADRTGAEGTPRRRSDRAGPAAASLLEPEESPSSAASSAAPEHVFAGKVFWQIVACAGAVVCFGIVAIAVNQYLGPPGRHRPKLPTVLGISGLFGVVGLVALYAALRIRGLKYFVYPDRLVAHDGGQVNVMRWDQIREVFHAVHPAWQTYRVVTRKGLTFKLTGDVRGHTRLGEIIAERVAACLLPDALAEVDAGRAVTFGPIRVSREGVHCPDRKVPWHQILSLSFGLNPRAVKGSMVSNMIHLRLADCVVEMGAISNYKLFEKLARHLHPTCVAETTGAGG